MSITENYKPISLTRTEVQAVEHALIDRIYQLEENWAFNDTPETRNRLAEARSALVKVRASWQP